MTPAQQIEELRKLGSGRFTLFWRCLVGLVIGLAVGVLLSNHPVFWMLFVFFLLIVIVERNTGSHVLRAAQALELGMKTDGVVEFEREDIDTFYAIIPISSNSKWRFPFRPCGWCPQEGEVSCELFSYPSVEWPVLVKTEKGILHPYSKPARVPL